MRVMRFSLFLGLLVVAGVFLGFLLGGLLKDKATLIIACIMFPLAFLLVLALNLKYARRQQDDQADFDRALPRDDDGSRPRRPPLVAIASHGARGLGPPAPPDPRRWTRACRCFTYPGSSRSASSSSASSIVSHRSFEDWTFNRTTVINIRVPAARELATQNRKLGLERRRLGLEPPSSLP